jgi:NitT/TauT family transport system substrate-binding protein
MKRALLALSLLLVLTWSTVQAQTAPADMTFFLTFVPNVQFSPLYVAIEKGYFAEEGLNLTIQHGDEPDGVNLIAANQLQFGMISGEQVIQARANGRPVVFVYEWFQQYPVGIVVADDSDVNAITDLAGRRVGIPRRFGASYSGLIALLAASGMQESDIQLEPIGFFAPDVFCQGGVEAAVVYINNEPLQIQRRAEAGQCGSVEGVRVFPVASAIDMVSNGIVTNEAIIEQQPELAQSVVRAFHRGLWDVIHNPAEAYLLSAVYVENLLPAGLEAALRAEAEDQAAWLADNPDRQTVRESRLAMRERLGEQVDPAALVQFDVLLNTIELWDADQLGLTTAESWQLTQDVLIQMGFIRDPISLDGAFTNQFVEGLEN